MKIKHAAALAVILAGTVAGWAGTGGGNERSSFRHQQHLKVRDRHEQRMQEDRQFREDLKGMTNDEKQLAVREQHELQHRENKAFRQQLRDENKAFLMLRLAGNRDLTEAVSCKTSLKPVE